MFEAGNIQKKTAKKPFDFLFLDTLFMAWFISNGSSKSNVSHFQIVKS